MPGDRPYGLAPPGFRLPDGTSVGSVRVQVSDLRRSADYYQEVLGLRVDVQASDVAALTPHASGRPLVWLHAGRTVRPSLRGAFGLYHFALLLPDRVALGRLAAHLSRRRVRVASADHRVSEALYLWDPDGLGIEVYADRPRSDWTHEGRELVMTTEPLDMGALVRAAGNRPWDGMPAGTAMGHVHLHVGGLDAAEAFYHRALGFEKTVWSYPGARFFSAGGYHHHLATNIWSPGPAAAPDRARLLEWEVVVPGEAAQMAAQSLRAAGYAAEAAGDGWTAADPWGTSLRIVSA
jgi:catechol 2,3-dioxygenase